jgi:RHS repeat-associated protein
MNELTATYHQNTTVLPEALTAVDTGSKKSPGKINGCFFQGLDYYPYGMEMPGRTFTAQTYRYAYQGSEQASEYNSAGGNVYTTFFRTLDSRLGRWHTPDVVSQPWQSPYCSMDNNPVALVDPWGAESEGGSSEPGFESGRGTNENPIQIEEITVTASRSAGTTSSAPSRTNIYVNTFNPENQAANQIRNQQAQEDFEDAQPEQIYTEKDNTNVDLPSAENLTMRMSEKDDPLQGDYKDEQKAGVYFYTEDGPGNNNTYADNIDKETDIELLLAAMDKKVDPEIPSSTKKTKDALSILEKIIKLFTGEQTSVEVEDDEDVDERANELSKEVHKPVVINRDTSESYDEGGNVKEYSWRNIYIDSSNGNRTVIQRIKYYRDDGTYFINVDTFTINK